MPPVDGTEDDQSHQCDATPEHSRSRPSRTLVSDEERQRIAKLLDVDLKLRDLEDYSRNPMIALLAHSVESGLHRYDWDEHISEATPQEVFNRALSDILDQVVSPEEKAHLMEQLTRAYSEDSALTTCASCGLRSMTTMETRELRDIDCLRLSSEQQGKFLAIPEEYRDALSVYQCQDQDGTDLYYHLHPEFVEPPPENEDDATLAQARLCGDCLTGIVKYASEPGSLNQRSLAAGVDFGFPHRLLRKHPHLLPLTPAERALIARARVYETVYKVNETSYNQNVLKGHAVVFLHNGIYTARCKHQLP